MGGIALGYYLGTRLAPVIDRLGLFDGVNDNPGGHTFAIDELTSPDSVSFDALKEKIRHDS